MNPIVHTWIKYRHQYIASINKRCGNHILKMTDCMISALDRERGWPCKLRWLLLWLSKKSQNSDCCDEVSDISFIEALYRILTLAADQLKNIGNFCEKTASAFFEAIMNTALQCVGLSKNNLVMNPESWLIINNLWNAGAISDQVTGAIGSPASLSQCGSRSPSENSCPAALGMQGTILRSPRLLPTDFF